MEGNMPTIPRASRLALLSALAFTLILPLAARADEASHRARAEELMTLLHTERTVQDISDSIRKQVIDAVESAPGPNPTPEQTAKVDDFKKKVTGMIDAQLGWEAMKSGFIDVYVKAFTEEQLDGIVAFYKSPAGVVLLEKMPEVNSQFGQLGQDKVSALQDQLRQAYEEFQKSIAPPASSAAPATVPVPTPATPLGPVK
jgi:uncharacterized protein